MKNLFRKIATILTLVMAFMLCFAFVGCGDNCVKGRTHSWEIQSATATCTQKGTITYKCHWCNKEKIENDVLKPHDFPLSPTSTTASCEKAGIETYKCRNCNETKTKSVEALGHDYTHRVCERCNYSPLRYFYFGFNLNSVGGVRAYVSSLTNTGNKRIKYISFNCYLYNSVGDAVADEIYGYTAIPVQLDGPFEIGEEKQNVMSGEVIGYCKRCAEIVIKDIKITYFDNSYEFVSNNYRYD